MSAAGELGHPWRDRFARWLLGFTVCAAALRVLSFPRSDEGWVDQLRLGERGFFGCLLPFDSYPYWRPLWHGYLKLCELGGITGEAAHLGPIVAHVAAVLCVYRLLERCGASRRAAFLPAVFAGVAPGTSGALSWLAAGNKAFTFFFLALGARLLVSVRGLRAAVLVSVCTLIPALGSSENAYLAVLLFPLVVGMRAPAGWRAALAVAGATLLLALGHHALLPQHEGAGTARFAELVAAMSADAFAWVGAVGTNLGRFFWHGLGLGDDWPIAGALALGLCATGAGLARDRALCLALGFFVLMNVPASLFPGESGRHHAYLPALGAGAVAASLVLRLPRSVVAPVASALLAFFLVQSWRAKEPWARYLEHCDRVRASVMALPDLGARASVPLFNVPLEYRTLFALRYGVGSKPMDWPGIHVLSTRDELLLPANGTIPGKGQLFEYDGERIVLTSVAEIAKRARAPLAWLVDEIRPFPDPFLALGDILESRRPFVQMPWGFEPTAPRGAGPGGTPVAGTVELRAQGAAPGAVYTWEVHGETDGPAWLVLGWPILAFPALTERAILFPLRRPAWPFRVEVDDLSGKRSAPELRPVLGFCPALRLSGGSFGLRVRLVWDR